MSQSLGVCWDPADVQKAISSAAQAQLNASRSHYFLATHAPIRRLWDDNKQTLLTEEEFFVQIMNPAHGEVLALVHGEPGTGKSHLIHWLKLRCDYALSQKELENIEPVLIERRDGTLRSALEQIIQQLGNRFQHYLKPVKEAMDRISDETAKETLALEISLEIGARRRDRHEEPLRGPLARLPDACREKGFIRWLCREDGVLARVVTRLVKGSKGVDTEALPEFTADELMVAYRYRTNQENSYRVIDLMLELDDSAKLRAEAAEVLNLALRPAIREMTGLSGGKLRDIFDQIRRELRKEGKTLAIFIEDVSAMGELDREVVSAVEPQPRPDLCRLVAVVGLVEAGLEQLRKNQFQRMTHQVAVGARDAGPWEDNAEELAKFTARYLNAIRLREEQVREIAKNRRVADADVTISKCSNCQQKTVCFEAFGKVAVDNVEIGMFPFRRLSPQRLLRNLDPQARSLRKTPRGLLVGIVRPVLAEQAGHIRAGSFPPSDHALPVSPPALSYWSAFENRYCGGWSDIDRRRLRFLAQYWTDANDPDAAAMQLRPLLEALKFPNFGGHTSSREKTEPTPDKHQPAVVKPTKGSSDVRLQQLLKHLTVWLDQGQSLVQDVEPRKLLAAFIKVSIAWDTERIPIRYLDASPEGYKFIHIAGQTSKPIGAHLQITFPRTKETRDLIEALAQFEFTGNRSWQFAGAEVHKRVVATWLRRHQREVIGKVTSAGELPTDVPIAVAIKILALSYVLRHKRQVPRQAEDLIEAILGDEWQPTEESAALSPAMRTLIEDVRSRHSALREFLIRELALVQGRGRPNFIDPIPILNHDLDLDTFSDLAPLSQGYFDNSTYWKSRYEAALARMRPDCVKTALADEQSSIASTVNEICATLREAGYDQVDISAALKAYIDDLGPLVEARVKVRGQIVLQDSPFESMWKNKHYTEPFVAWAQLLENAQTLVQTKPEMQTLTFDVQLLTELKQAIQTAADYASTVESQLGEQESAIAATSVTTDAESALLAGLMSVVVANEPATGKDGLKGEGNVSTD